MSRQALQFNHLTFSQWNEQRFHWIPRNAVAVAACDLFQFFGGSQIPPIQALDFSSSFTAIEHLTLNLDIEQQQEMDVLRCRIILAAYICLIGAVECRNAPKRCYNESREKNWKKKLCHQTGISGRKNMSSNWHMQMYVSVLISLGKPQALC